MSNGGGGPPPLPAGGGGAGGGVGGAAAACKWEIFVTVHSQERFWPGKDFAVKLHQLKDDGSLGAVAYNQNVAMVVKDSPQVKFCDEGTKTFGATATVDTIADEADWVLAASATSNNPLPNKYVRVSVRNGNMGKQAKKVNLYVRHPLLVHLQLKFKDPEGRVLTFPKDFPVQVYHIKKVAQHLTDADGKLSFEVPRKYDWITLKFGAGKTLVSNADGATTATELKRWDDRKALMNAQAKFFSPPNQFALVESVWDFSEEPKYIDKTAAYKKNEGKVYLFDPATRNWVRRIGEKAAPVVLTLDPHWQFVRLEYFDRYYGHSDHGHEKVNTPPVLLEGFHGTGKKLDREGAGHWPVKPDKRAESAHAVPWIRQKDGAGAAVPRPTKNCLLMFETAPGTFVFSSAPDAREIQVLNKAHKADADRLRPSAERLKLYDLPARWKSAKYFARFKSGAGYAGNFYEDWADADHGKSRALATPMVFSLDDMVLTNAANQPLALAKNEKISIFYHRFKPAYNEVANVTPEGVYKPDAAEPYYSSITLQGADFNYLTEYPNWVRLVAGMTALFDAFDQRTKSGVHGARAAVRWYNPRASGTAAGKNIGTPGPVVKPFFALQPYAGQWNPTFIAQYKGPNTAALRDGRYDVAVVRCCDRDGAKEVLLDINYARLRYTFTAGTTVAPGAQKAWAVTSVRSLLDRWNGIDAGAPGRCELVPADPAHDTRGEIIFFLHPAATDRDAHFRMSVYNIIALGQRAFMAAGDGTGELDDVNNTPDGANSVNSFTFAHEFGHGTGLPDEYGEWWNNCSHNGPGIVCNIPGDPFVDEGRDFDLTGSIYAKGAAPAAPGTEAFPMMTAEVELRNRYFWHTAELTRKHTGIPWLVKLGAHADYKVPGHNKYPKRAYTYWPANAAINHTPGTRGKMDVYLHTAGKEEFTVKLLPAQYGIAGPFDGVLSVVVKIRMDVVGTIAAGYPAGGGVTPVEQVRNDIRNAFLTYSGKHYALGDVDVKTDAGKKGVTLNKCMFRLSPRFLISNADPALLSATFTKANYDARFKNLNTTVGTHFTVNVKDVPGGGASGYQKTNKRTLDLVIDLAGDPKAANTLQAAVNRNFSEMLGVPFDPAKPVLKAADFKGIAQKVFAKNGDVK